MIIFHQQVKYILCSIFTFRAVCIHTDVWKYCLFLYQLFTFLYFNTSLEVNLSFFFTYQSEKNSACKRKSYLCYCCLLTSLSSSEPKTKDLCTLDRMILSFLMACCIWTKKLNCCLCSFTSCLFLYSTGFILLMHFDDEESLLQDTMNLSV